VDAVGAFVGTFWENTFQGSPFLVAEGGADFIGAIVLAVQSWYHGEGFNICKFEGVP
jgi:hypothetical protein